MRGGGEVGTNSIYDPKGEIGGSGDKVILDRRQGEEE